MRQPEIAAVGLITFSDSLQIVAAKGYLGRDDSLMMMAVLSGVIGTLASGFLLIGTAYRSKLGASFGLGLCISHVAGVSVWSEIFIRGCSSFAWLLVCPWCLNMVFLSLGRLAGSLARASGHVGPGERVGPSICDRCNYNLTGNVTGVCPECGAPIPNGKTTDIVSGGSRES